MQNRTAARNRNWFRSIRSVPSGDGDSPDEGGQQEDGHDLERDQVRPEHGVGHIGRALHAGDADLVVAEGIGEYGDHDTEQEQAGQGGQPPLVVVEGCVAPDRSPGEHRPEQEEHDDGADVDDDLHDEDELRGQQQVLGAGAGQNDHQIEHGSDDVLGRHDLPRGDDHDGSQDAEDDVLGDHGTANLLLHGLGAHFQRSVLGHGVHPLAELVLVVQEVGDLPLRVLVLGAPEQSVEGAHVYADPAVHAQRVVDVEAVESVDLAGTTAGAPRRRLLLVTLDVDAPVGAAAGAQHADGAVLLLEGDDAARPQGGRLVLPRVLGGDGGLEHGAERHTQALHQALARNVRHQKTTLKTAVTRMLASERGMRNFHAKAWSWSSRK